MTTLEEEFEEFKALHKYSVLKAKIVMYYADLQDTGVNISYFLREDTPDKLADRDLKTLLSSKRGFEEFNRLYEIAWKELAELLP